MSGEKLRIRGSAVVYVDWANVYGWRKSLKHEVDTTKLYTYLRQYPEIGDIRLYHGTDTHPKSQSFLDTAQNIGYSIITKPVKYITVGNDTSLRKCDFDMEVCIDAHKALADDVTSFIFFTGDGDYEPLYKLLIEQKKQVIVIFANGHLGREVHQLEKLYKRPVDTLEDVFG